MALTRIIFHLPNLVKYTEINDDFKAKLVSNKLITEEALAQCENQYKNNQRRFPYSVFQEIEKEVGDDVNKLVDVLLETGNTRAARFLCPQRVNENNKDRNHSSQRTASIRLVKENGMSSCPVYDGCILSRQSSDEVDHAFLTIDVLPGAKIFRGEDIYEMGPGTGRGQALILNFEHFDPSTELRTRRGSQVDVSNLDNLFTQMGFQVNVAEDLMGKETLKTIIDFSNDKLHNSGNMMILVVLSHGKDGGMIYTSDGTKLNIYQDILR